MGGGLIGDNNGFDGVAGEIIGALGAVKSEARPLLRASLRVLRVLLQAPYRRCCRGRDTGAAAGVVHGYCCGSGTGATRNKAP